MTGLPFQPPIAQMLAKPVGDEVPAPDSVAGGLRYDPKWDGFRILVFRDTDEQGRDRVVLQGRFDGSARSRSAKDLAYAFPEILPPLAQALPEGTVLDGELIIVRNGRLRFEELGMRLRPRSEEGGWKIRELSEQHPASFVAFDALAIAGEDLRGRPDAERRRRLEDLLASAAGPVHCSPTTTDAQRARAWFTVFEGAGLDGVIARPMDAPYAAGKRLLLKVKHRRTADVVIAGWRPYKQPGSAGQPVVGSLLLGLYDEAGGLHHVGVASSFTAARREQLLEELAPVGMQTLEGHPWAHWAQAGTADPSPGSGRRMPGAPSRWSGGKDLSWIPLRPELVAEVGYDHMQGERFRHVAKFLRWREDRTPASCTYSQLDRPVRFDLDEVLQGAQHAPEPGS